MTTGSALYGLVEEYSGMGFHRTGSEVDLATADWMAEQLSTAGFSTHLEDVAFEQFVSSSSLTVSGDEIFHLVVPYTWTGQLETSSVTAQALDPKYGGTPDVLEEPITGAAGSGHEAAIFATSHAEGSLQAINRELGPVPVRFPTVLVAGNQLETVQSDDIRLQISASLRPGVTRNVIGRNRLAVANPSASPLVLTTPLSGWFMCAGERGTGIAVLLGMLERLEDRPVLVVATGGHELGWFGATRWVDNADVTPSTSIHVGASIAVLEPGDGADRELAGTRFALTSVPDRSGELAEALAAARLNLRTEAESWVGEGQPFSQLSGPLLSMSGAGLDFHTPQDTPERATSPDALETALEAITAATLVLDNQQRS